MYYNAPSFIVDNMKRNLIHIILQNGKQMEKQVSYGISKIL